MPTEPAAPSASALNPIFDRLSVDARVFFSGMLCGTASFPGEGEWGHLHLLRAGSVTVTPLSGPPISIKPPSALLFPRPSQHALDSAGDADLVCAEIKLGGVANPFYWGLPDFLCLGLEPADSPLKSVLDLLFAEAADGRTGRQAVMNRLAEVTLIHFLRHVLARGSDEAGILAGLAHPQLCRALAAMHERPDADWTLEALADIAGLSRSAFSDLFGRVVGRPPGQYLGAWRLALAREALGRGVPLKKVARDVGYQSPAAFSRAFSRHFGVEARSVRKTKTAGETAPAESVLSE